MAGYSKFINNLSDFGISKKDFENEKEKLSEKFKLTANDGDVLWSLYNKLVTKTKDTHLLKCLYYEMALLLNKEGKDYFTVRQMSQKMEILGYKESGVVKAVEILANVGCDECKKLHGNKYTIDEALEKMPIPNPKCTFCLKKEGKPFCRCTYLPVIE